MLIGGVGSKLFPDANDNIAILCLFAAVVVDAPPTSGSGSRLTRETGTLSAVTLNNIIFGIEYTQRKTLRLGAWVSESLQCCFYCSLDEEDGGGGRMEDALFFVGLCEAVPTIGDT